MEKADSGDVLEYLLIEDIFDIELLMSNNETEKLLDSNLYISNDLEELKKIYNSIINKKEEAKYEIINKLKELENNDDVKVEEKEEEEEEEGKKEEGKRVRGVIIGRGGGREKRTDEDEEEK